METFEAIATKLDVRRYANTAVPEEVKRKTLEAGRLTGSGINAQHWRFVLVDDPERLQVLAANSTSGGWAAAADFAVIVATSPQYDFASLDAGRAVQAMQLAAWDEGVVSGIFTGVDQEAMRRDFGIPSDLEVSAVATFGYPERRVMGRKRRLPLEEVAFRNRFGNRFEAERADG
ncbi:MAG: nitroreductase family protein [Actinomycetota bacterium]|nr:nitroreductase family protein [Actinomycetota bacterium]